MTALPPEPGIQPPSPWGSFPPPPWPGFLIRVARAWPRWRLLRRLAFPIRRLARSSLGSQVDSTLWDQRLRFNPRGNVSEGRLLFFPWAWDRQERALLESILKPGSVFVDVGSNFGGYTWWVLSRLGKRCTVVAVEPDPELGTRLRFNLDTNGWDHVRVLSCAVGAEEGRALLHISGANRGESTLLDRGAPGETDAVEVPVRALKRLLEEEGLTRLDILKIDIEGLEPPVLRAFFGGIPGPLRPRWIFCERKDTPEHRELEVFLQEQGYTLALRTRLNMVLREEGAPASEGRSATRRP